MPSAQRDTALTAATADDMTARITRAGQPARQDTTPATVNPYP
jgi:hypothetical protein